MDKESIINYVMETPSNSNRAVLNSMLNQIEGDKLPSVNEEDNGKVLTVVEGEWTPATASGGGGGGSAPMKVRVMDDGEGTLVLDKTWQEIYDAFPNVLVEHSFESEGGMIITRTNAVSELEACGVEGQPEVSMYSLIADDPYDTTDPNGYPTNGGK